MAESSNVKISRDELYILLWQNAAYKIAAAYGMSHESLVQICKHHQIPRPPRAYWIMVSKGRFVDRPPLPQVGDNVEQIIQITPDEKLKPTTPLPPLKSEPLPIITKPIQIAVRDTLFSPSPLVQRTMFCLRAGTPGDDGLIRLNNNKGCLDVAVSRREIGRAMRFLDTLIKAAESRGMTVRLEYKDGKEKTLLSMGTTDLSVRFWEMCSGLGRKKYAKGQFYMVLDSRAGKDRNWNEHDGKPLETRIESILDTALRMAEYRRRTEQEWEQRDREWAEDKRQREEAEAIRSKHEMLKSQLEEQVRRWHEAERVRTYLWAVKAKAGDVEPNSQLGRWLDWASKYAAALDPLNELFNRCCSRFENTRLTVEPSSAGGIDQLPDDYPTHVNKVLIGKFNFQ